MGKRKERRLAALSNAGRRVKVDLFAEPSGDLGESTSHDAAAGGDMDSKHRDGLPNSPSSSGQQPQNPLLLLGQYSDDEVDEGSSKGPNDAKALSSMPNGEAKGSIDEGSKELDISASDDLVAQNDGQQKTMLNFTLLDVEGSDKNESDVADGNLQNEMVSTDQVSISETSNPRVITDVSSVWKMVMHEESKCYYYWNTETGETSWEVPQVLAQGAQLASDQTSVASANDKTEIAAVGVDNSNMPSAVMQNCLAAFTINGSLETTVTSQREVYGHGSQMDGWSDEYTNENRGAVVNGNELRSTTGLLGMSYGGDHSFVSKFSVEEQQSEIDFPSCLVKRSESLLERLKSLDKSNGNLQCQDSLSKYILEIEIRLSDIRSLASHGSSLLPFWVYSDRRIKLLESVINDDLLQTAKSVQDEVEDNKQVPDSGGLDVQQNSMGHECEEDHHENNGSFLTSETSNGSQLGASTIVPKDIYDKIPTNDGHLPLSDSPSSHMETSVEVSTQIDATIPPEESTHKHGFNIGEDVDMDVDMEVEDMNSSGNTTVVDVLIAKSFEQTDQLVQFNTPADYHSLLPEDEFVVPPPPDDEWIPPPPPDNEQMPPPPPPDNEQASPPPPPPDNELLPPPASSYPALPSYAEAGESLSYPQYSLPYLGGSSEYYGQTATEVPSSNIYGHAEGCQVSVVPAQLYYSSVPITYSESSQDIINPTEPVPPFELQDGTVSRSMPDLNNNDSGVGGADRGSDDVPSTSSSIQEPATVAVDWGVSWPSTTTSAAAGSATLSSVAKVPTKVVRSRKRAVAVGSSLKSKKKVSSLVDKWKAAKEELLEEEEEPESAYEILERKRQREIEEWRAKQIASGEAKDNANFQPLGGDWREQVKHKRAKTASESVDFLQDAVERNPQQPDLTELSDGLPSGWLAYWDESSKQVYYANSVTSETTWIRPTK